MIDKPLQDIEKTVTGAEALSDKKKAELRALISKLRNEITTLSETHREIALSIAGFSKTSTRQATGEDEDKHLLASSLEDLSTTVKTFEASHPGLVSTVNAFCNALADIGI